MERIKEKLVWLPTGRRESLARAMGVNGETVSRALNGKESEVCARIRYMACKEFGGKVVEWDLPVGCEVVGVMIHDHVGGRRIVNMDRGWYLITYEVEGVVRLERASGVYAEWDARAMTISGYCAVMESALLMVAGQV